MDTIKVYVFRCAQSMGYGFVQFTAPVASVEEAEQRFGHDYARALDTTTWETVWVSTRGQEVHA